MLLGDPRWVGPFCAAAAGHTARARRLLAHGVRWSPQALEEARRQLAQPCVSGGEYPVMPLLATVLGHWGPEAAAAIPELLGHCRMLVRRWPWRCCGSATAPRRWCPS
jgi:hypothetical protein